MALMTKQFGGLTIMSAVALAALTGPAHTQDVGNVFTDEVVVTAQKREQNLQDVGIAVTAVTGAQMQALGYTNAQEITALTPGVSTIQPNGEANYAIGIRGVANNDFTTNVESPIAVYVDEVYISQMSGAGFMLFDMERAEVLRGPQGTLFGRNATGGLVQYVTVKPENEVGGYGSLSYGKYNQLKYQGAVNVPLSDRLAVRVSAAAHQRDGYVRNRVLPDQELNNANDFAGRVQVLWEGDAWDALLNLRQGEQDIRTGFFQHVTTLDSGTLSPAGTRNPYLNDANGDPGYFDNDGDPYAGDYDFLGHNDLETKGQSLTLKYDTGGVKFTSITDFSTTERDYIEDSDASPENYFNFFLTTDAEQFSQEFRFEGETEDSRWVVGAYYLDLEVNDSNGAIAPGFISDFYKALCTNFDYTPGTTDEAGDCSGALLSGAFDDSVDGVSGFPNTVNGYDIGAGVVGTGHGIWSPYTTETESISIFGQWEQDISNDLTFIIGGRLIEEEKDHYYRNLEVNFDERATSGVDSRTTAAFDPDVPANDLREDGQANGSVFAVYRGDRDDSEWAARLQLDWRPADDTLYYVSWNRGVKSGGFNAPLLPTVDFNLDGVKDDTSVTDIFMSYEPEQLDAYEIGFKKQFRDNRITLNGSAYYYEYEDYQAFAILGLDTFTLNAEAESTGFELELQASPSAGLDFLFGVGYIDAEVTNVPGVSENRPGIFLATVPDDQVGRTVQPVQTPEWNLNGLVRYEVPSAAGNWAFQLDAEYRDEHYFNLTNAATLTENGYTLLNGSIAFFPANNENVTIRLAGYNLTDEEYIVQGFDLGGTVTNGSGFWGMTEHYYGKPRTFSVSMNYLF